MLILQRIEITAPERNKIYENFSVPVVEALDKMGIDYDMHALNRYTPFGIKCRKGYRV